MDQHANGKEHHPHCTFLIDGDIGGAFAGHRLGRAMRAASAARGLAPTAIEIYQLIITTIEFGHGRRPAKYENRLTIEPWTVQIDGLSISEGLWLRRHHAADGIRRAYLSFPLRQRRASMVLPVDGFELDRL